MKLNRAIWVIAAALAVFGSSSTAEQAPARPRAGQYACVFAFGGHFFDTKPIFIGDNNKYESSSGQGSWRYARAARRITFETGVLATDYPAGQYVESGPVRGGLKNKKGPAIVLRPSAAYQKRQGQQAVPQYCYLASDK